MTENPSVSPDDVIGDVELVIAKKVRDREAVSTESLIDLINNPEWPDPSDQQDDWRFYIPDYLHAHWSQLPFIARLIAIDLASRHAEHISWEHEESLNRLWRDD